MKRKRTTHSDLADLLDALAAKLASIPQSYCVSDPSTLRLLTDAARALYEQDLRIGEQNSALRGSIEQQRAALQRIAR